MAASTTTPLIEHIPATPEQHKGIAPNGSDDVFFANHNGSANSYQHRFAPRFDLETSEPGLTASPLQAKRKIEAHLAETDRRLQDTQKLGTSLIQQREDLAARLEELEQHQDKEAVPDELTRRLLEIEQEHADVGRAVARALIAPKAQPEEMDLKEPSIYSSHPAGSPVKASAPSRKHRNQPSTKAGDLQFAADISTSLLAQVRTLQAAVTEKDEALRKAQAERERIDHDVLFYNERIRVLDDSELKYKDENWELEAQNQQLRRELQDSQDREKKLSTNFTAIQREQSDLQTELEELTLANGKLAHDHSSLKRTHESEIHNLKRDADSTDLEHKALQDKIDRLSAQNAQFAKELTIRWQQRDTPHSGENLNDSVDDLDDTDTPEQSPTGSPVKATPGKPMLDSDTLRGSLNHAHRTIQNLKNNIHREKTEKFEIKRLLQETREELESARRGDLTTNKRGKPKPEATTKKLGHPSMLGATRHPRRDVEMQDDDEDWEEQNIGMPSQHRSASMMNGVSAFASQHDVSDAYQTANETEAGFETAEEPFMTESEVFMTGAESLAEESTDELTETESTMSRKPRRRTASKRIVSVALASRRAGDRASFMSTASTSADEADEISTPTQPTVAKFKLRSTATFPKRNTISLNATPQSMRSTSMASNTPSTIAGEDQTLFAELGETDELNSQADSTPARSMMSSARATPAADSEPNRPLAFSPIPISLPAKAEMVDSSTMTDTYSNNSLSHYAPQVHTDTKEGHFSAFYPADFPLPSSLPASPTRRIDNGTQYTPGRNMADSPSHHPSYITPPRTIWDDEEEHNSPFTEMLPTQTSATQHGEQLQFSGMLHSGIEPVEPVTAVLESSSFEFSTITSQHVQPVEAALTVKTDETPESLSITVPVTIFDQQEISYEPQTPGASHIVMDSVKSFTPVSTGQPGMERTPAVLLNSPSRLSTRVERGPVVFEDATSGPAMVANKTVSSSTSPLQEVSGNARTPRDGHPRVLSYVDLQSNEFAVKHDQSAQTLLTGNQVEEALRSQNIIGTPSAQAVSTVATPEAHTMSSAGTPSRPATATRVLIPATVDRADDLSSDVSRSASVVSLSRASISSRQHPPLPVGHKDIIAEAATRPGSPAKKGMLKSGGIMGPPLMPASAMRSRSKTQNEVVRSVGRNSMQRSTNSRLSRHSSVASFASEVDEHFHLGSHSQPVQTYSTGSTDPRMIQAITQTMIGEYLFKYTRKTGSKDMSNTRHQRYFWIHPYTKTLYWSETDPQTAGKQSTSRSVAIESVREIDDDNHNPPGLHHRSLEITAQGRKVVFTASTAQRHQTWYSALSYLLNRDSDNVQASSTDVQDNITVDDLNEFSVGRYNARLVPGDQKHSMSAQNSRSTSRNKMRQSLPSHIVVGSAQSRNCLGDRAENILGHSDDTIRQNHRETQDNDRTLRATSLSRMQRMMASMSGRTSQASVRDDSSMPALGSQSTDSMCTPGSNGQGSREDIRREMLLRQVIVPGQRSNHGHHDHQGLENVRACCEGRHDVGTLNCRNEPGAVSFQSQRVANAISRSVSRRT